MALILRLGDTARRSGPDTTARVCMEHGKAKCQSCLKKRLRIRADRVRTEQRKAWPNPPLHAAACSRISLVAGAWSRPCNSERRVTLRTFRFFASALCLPLPGSIQAGCRFRAHRPRLETGGGLRGTDRDCDLNDTAFKGIAEVGLGAGPPTGSSFPYRRVAVGGLFK